MWEEKGPGWPGGQVRAAASGAKHVAGHRWRWWSIDADIRVSNGRNAGADGDIGNANERELLPSAALHSTASGSGPVVAADGAGLLAVFDQLPVPVTLIRYRDNKILLQNEPSRAFWGACTERVGPPGEREPLLELLFRLSEDVCVDDVLVVLQQEGTWKGLMLVPAPPFAGAADHSDDDDDDHTLLPPYHRHHHQQQPHDQHQQHQQQPHDQHHHHHHDQQHKHQQLLLPPPPHAAATINISQGSGAATAAGGNQHAAGAQPAAAPQHQLVSSSADPHHPDSVNSGRGGALALALLQTTGASSLGASDHYSHGNNDNQQQQQQQQQQGVAGAVATGVSLMGPGGVPDDGDRGSGAPNIVSGGGSSGVGSRLLLSDGHGGLEAYGASGACAGNSGGGSGRPADSRVGLQGRSRLFRDSSYRNNTTASQQQQQQQQHQQQQSHLQHPQMPLHRASAATIDDVGGIGIGSGGTQQLSAARLLAPPPPMLASARARRASTTVLMGGSGGGSGGGVFGSTFYGTASDAIPGRGNWGSPAEEGLGALSPVAAASGADSAGRGALQGTVVGFRGSSSVAAFVAGTGLPGNANGAGLSSVASAAAAVGVGAAGAGVPSGSALSSAALPVPSTASISAAHLSHAQSQQPSQQQQLTASPSSPRPANGGGRRLPKRSMSFIVGVAARTAVAVAPLPSSGAASGTGGTTPNSINLLSSGLPVGAAAAQQPSVAWREPEEAGVAAVAPTAASFTGGVGFGIAYGSGGRSHAGSAGPQGQGLGSQQGQGLGSQRDRAQRDLLAALQTSAWGTMMMGGSSRSPAAGGGMPARSPPPHAGVAQRRPPRRARSVEMLLPAVAEADRPSAAAAAAAAYGTFARAQHGLLAAPMSSVEVSSPSAASLMLAVQPSFASCAAMQRPSALLLQQQLLVQQQQLQQPGLQQSPLQQSPREQQQQQQQQQTSTSVGVGPAPRQLNRWLSVPAHATAQAPTATTAAAQQAACMAGGSRSASATSVAAAALAAPALPLPVGHRTASGIGMAAAPGVIDAAVVAPPRILFTAASTDFLDIGGAGCVVPGSAGQTSTGGARGGGAASATSLHRTVDVTSPSASAAAIAAAVSVGGGNGTTSGGSAAAASAGGWGAATRCTDSTGQASELTSGQLLPLPTESAAGSAAASASLPQSQFANSAGSAAAAAAVAAAAHTGASALTAGGSRLGGSDVTAGGGGARMNLRSGGGSHPLSGAMHRIVNMALVSMSPAGSLGGGSGDRTMNGGGGGGVTSGVTSGSLGGGSGSIARSSARRRASCILPCSSNVADLNTAMDRLDLCVAVDAGAVAGCGGGGGGGASSRLGAGSRTGTASGSGTVPFAQATTQQQLGDMMMDAALPNQPICATAVGSSSTSSLSRLRSAGGRAAAAGPDAPSQSATGARHPLSPLSTTALPSSPLVCDAMAVAITSPTASRRPLSPTALLPHLPTPQPLAPAAFKRWSVTAILEDPPSAAYGGSSGGGAAAAGSSDVVGGGGGGGGKQRLADSAARALMTCTSIGTSGQVTASATAEGVNGGGGGRAGGGGGGGGDAQDGEGVEYSAFGLVTTTDVGGSEARCGQAGGGAGGAAAIAAAAAAAAADANISTAGYFSSATNAVLTQTMSLQLTRPDSPAAAAATAAASGSEPASLTSELARGAADVAAAAGAAAANTPAPVSAEAVLPSPRASGDSRPASGAGALAAAGGGGGAAAGATTSGAVSGPMSASITFQGLLDGDGVPVTADNMTAGVGASSFRISGRQSGADAVGSGGMRRSPALTLAAGPTSLSGSGAANHGVKGGGGGGGGGGGSGGGTTATATGTTPSSGATPAGLSRRSPAGAAAAAAAATSCRSGNGNRGGTGHGAEVSEAEQQLAAALDSRDTPQWQLAAAARGSNDVVLAASPGAHGGSGGGGQGGRSVDGSSDCTASAATSAAVNSTAAAAAAGGNASCAGGEQWHEVSIRQFVHPVLKETVLLLVQNDVTARIWAERQLARVVEAEHTLLENIFPHHVIEHIATATARAAAGCGPLPAARDSHGGYGASERGSSAHHRPHAHTSNPHLDSAAAAAAPRASRAGAAAGDTAESSARAQQARAEAGAGAGAGAAMSPEDRERSQLHQYLHTQHSVDRYRAGGGAGGGSAGGTGNGHVGHGGGGGGGLGRSALPAIRGDTFLHLATSHSMITVMFCDIQGFTPMCKEVRPVVVMAFLNDLFTRLDALLDEFGVYKVETIGDCYVAAGGLMKTDEDTGAVTVRSDDVDPLHAYRTVQFAKALLRAASAVRLPTTGQPVRMRVGIHSGSAMSGVVGTRMPRFCLFGDTMNTASRMESSGEPGAIHVSAATRELVPGEDWEPTGGVDVKGKGRMDTYLLRP
ncbi:hypothetical protein CHLRE_13g603350v5 [Chlamydomonas reinhardtii]|uniref:Guanylate cyclase domain-containing protein n=1 Tax=Chlamydomonas reinhardtii TaxID=3055 RepID=A0A2K3D194_CHLRE|nr:uncharacterized protein CHLRE_13g603350v5 [Chlamydomonas reinhardtii]PNW74300.1 hypothetical protein CHLRE_13g603350v5 [Chlamydomonas reinhardtii]